MLDGLEARLEKLDGDERQLFFELLAHNLTVVIRGIWSDASLAPAQQIDRIKWVNEILHRVTAKIRCLRLNTHEWTDADSVNDMRHWIAQNSAIEGDIQSAVRWSLSALDPSGSNKTAK